MKEFKIRGGGAHTYCQAVVDGWCRCDAKIPVTERFCSSHQPKSASSKDNLGDPAKSGREKGTACLSSPARAVTQKPLYRMSEIIDWQEWLGPMAEKMIREAHGEKCRHCGEPIGELKIGKKRFGWVHRPETGSYTFCESRDGVPKDLTKVAEP